VLRNRLHHDAGFGDTESGATVFFWHGNTQPTTFSYRLHELVGVIAGIVAIEPVIGLELAA